MAGIDRSMRYAIVDENNIVINVIKWDGVSEYNPGEGKTVVKAEYVNIGDQYNSNDGSFSPQQ